jgi:hypothetical protein
VRASLARPPIQPTRPALPLLDPRGARVILGARPALPVAPIVPSASALFGPRGACLAAPDGPLLVCDTGHHRLLIWQKAPRIDNAPADVVIGQPDFAAEGRNAKGEVGAATLNVPTGIAVADGVVALADAWNHRVLLWLGVPTRSNQPADVVLGTGYLNWPYGVALYEGRLYVADTGNHRVLIWDAIPERDGAAPDRIIGDKMRWPHAIAAVGERVFVADAGAGCVWTIGGAAIESELGMPYGVTIQGTRLIVADTANSRLVGFPLQGGEPQWLAGQRSFSDKGDNRWAAAARDSVCWPYGLSACASTLVVADSGNNRVLLWESA